MSYILRIIIKSLSVSYKCGELKNCTENCFSKHGNKYQFLKYYRSILKNMRCTETWSDDRNHTAKSPSFRNRKHGHSFILVL